MLYRMVGRIKRIRSRAGREQTRVPAGPARLAAATGAQIILVDNTFTADGWGLRFHSPFVVNSRDEANSATQRIADGFAADIAANPADWHMMQKLWLADMSDERRRAMRNKPDHKLEDRQDVNLWQVQRLQD